MTHFNYLLDKINSAEFNHSPFPFLYIEDFLDHDDFKSITNSSLVNIHSEDVQALISTLTSNKWDPIVFPGCTIDINDYINFIQNQSSSYQLQTTCEGFGITFRLSEKVSFEPVNSLHEFFNSEQFLSTVISKFQLPSQNYSVDTGLQKYLNHYEISPHPDIRKKALTYMLNLNPSSNSQDQSHHTHFMTFKDPYKYIYEFWSHNQQFDRCWVPWDWCNTHFIHNKNNSITIFSPCDYSLHAVKASYDHLAYQRTQFYGNLWYQNSPNLSMPTWNNLDISSSVQFNQPSITQQQPSREQFF